MIDKSVSTLSDAIAGIHDGATIMIGGFGPAGQPTYLIDALIEQGARDLTIINNNAGNGEVGLAALLKAGRVRKMVCSFPRQVDSQIFDDLYRRGKVELELVPQVISRRESRRRRRPGRDIYADRLRHARWLKAKETREIDGRHYVLEYPIKADFALIKAHQADRWGNLVYRKAARNFGPIMATAAKTTIVEVSRLVSLGDLDPENVITPGIFVQRVFSLEHLTTAQRA
ncbi:3-oxoadipate CoA-transferase subunit A [Raoultella ornithinolytica]|nr:3-oxoadipate CoA-transferase subunit A [Raoultella ornithinolytica]